MWEAAVERSIDEKLDMGWVIVLETVWLGTEGGNWFTDCVSMSETAGEGATDEYGDIACVIDTVGVGTMADNGDTGCVFMS